MTWNNQIRDVFRVGGQGPGVSAGRGSDLMAVKAGEELPGVERWREVLSREQFSECWLC